LRERAIEHFDFIEKHGVGLVGACDRRGRRKRKYCAVGLWCAGDAIEIEDDCAARLSDGDVMPVLIADHHRRSRANIADADFRQEHFARNTRRL
jgi:hypothetical protein